MYTLSGNCDEPTCHGTLCSPQNRKGYIIPRRLQTQRSAWCPVRFGGMHGGAPITASSSSFTRRRRQRIDRRTYVLCLAAALRRRPIYCRRAREFDCEFEIKQRWRIFIIDFSGNWPKGACPACKRQFVGYKNQMVCCASCGNIICQPQGNLNSRGRGGGTPSKSEPEIIDVEFEEK